MSQLGTTALHRSPSPKRASEELTDESFLPVHILFLHNFTNLFVNKTVGVIIGKCLQQLLIGLLFLLVLRNISYIWTPNLLHREHIRILSPAAQVVSYTGVWGLLVVYDCLLATWVQKRLLMATERLADSMQDRALQRHLMLRSPTVLSEVDEDEACETHWTTVNSPSRSESERRLSMAEEVGVPLDLTLEEESLLNPVRMELQEGSTKWEDKLRRLPTAIRPSVSEIEEEEPRLVISLVFMRYVGWQVVSNSFISIPAWAIPDVINALHVSLTVAWSTQHTVVVPLILSLGSLLAAAMLIVLVNSSFLTPKKWSSETIREREIEEHDPSHLKHHFSTVSDQPYVRPTISAFFGLLPHEESLRAFRQFAAENILFSLGLFVGISFEILLDSLAEDFVAGSYLLEVFNSFLTTFIVAFIQWKFLDTSFDPKNSTDFVTNVKRFISTALTLMVAWSIKYAVSDTRTLVLESLASFYKWSPSPSGIRIGIPAHSGIGIHTHLQAAERDPLLVNTTLTSFTFPSTSESPNVSKRLPIFGEFLVALAVMVFFGLVVGLLTVWQTNAIRRSVKLRYRQQFVRLVIMGCGTVIGCSWSTFFAVVYKEVIGLRAPAERPWKAAFGLVCFVFVILEVCCVFSMIFIFWEEKAKERWRFNLERERRRQLRQHLQPPIE